MTTIIKIISLNVRELSCPTKRENVKWVLCRYCCDVTILLKSELELGRR